MNLANFVPLAFALLVLAFAGLTPYVRRLDDLFTRIAFALFGTYVTEFGRNKTVRQKNLRAAHVASNYREHATRTILLGAVVALGTGIVGMYVIWGVLLVLIIPKETVREVMPPQLDFLAAIVGLPKISVLELFAIIAFGCLTIGAVTGFGTYWYKWYQPKYLADERERQIDISMPMTVSFVYALSRSGMPFPKIMEILAENEHVYGHAAGEVRVAVRNMEVFGMDVITAVKTMARRTPSSKFQEFSENLSSVLQTGGSLSEFLHRQYQEYRQEAEAQQERLLELIETLAEVYVTLGVAGPLFMITILTMLGIAVTNALPILKIFVYALIPLGNLGFIIYLSTVVDNLSRKDPTDKEVEIASGLRGVRRVDDVALETQGPEAVAEATATRTDGGTDAAVDVRRDPTGSVANMQRLKAYKTLRELQRRLGSPLRTIIKQPTSLLWISFPVAVFLIGIRLPFFLLDGALTVAEVDDLFIQSLLFVFGTFAIAYEVHRRRIEAIEEVIPDFLDRLASLNEAGMTVTESLRRIRRTELGPLDEELEIVWQDIRWGADVETALKRFEDRIKTKTVSRIVTLTTEAMKASGNLGTVLRIAAEQAKSDRRLKQKRRQEMVTYMVVVYISFFVFLFIVAVLNSVLFPSLPETAAVPNPGDMQASPVPAVENLGKIDQAAYQIVFLHAAVIQGLFSGLVAGQLSAGDIRAGAKHVTILVGLGYAAFILVL